LHTLERDVVRAWPGFYRQALNQESVKVEYQNVKRLLRGQLPQPTAAPLAEPAIHRLFAMPRFGDRTVLLYDQPGAAFDSETGMAEQASTLVRGSCLLLLISLADLGQPMHQGMRRLLKAWVAQTAGRKPRAQHLVVVYSKADLLVDRFPLPQPVVDYLIGEDIQALADVAGYLALMRRISSMLEEFTAAALYAREFAELAQRHFRTVSYCAVSALGSSPAGTRLDLSIAPRRVVDPLLWVLKRSDWVRP
jgi:hypothetical protein